MNEETLISLNEAKQSFVELMRSLNRTDQQKFLAFIMEEWKLEPSIVYNDSGLLYFGILYYIFIIIFLLRLAKKSDLQGS